MRRIITASTKELRELWSLASKCREGYKKTFSVKGFMFTYNAQMDCTLIVSLNDIEKSIVGEDYIAFVVGMIGNTKVFIETPTCDNDTVRKIASAFPLSKESMVRKLSVRLGSYFPAYEALLHSVKPTRIRTAKKLRYKDVFIVDDSFYWMHGKDSDFFLSVKP